MTEVVIVPAQGTATIELAPAAALAVGISVPVAVEVQAIGYPGPAGRDGAAAGAYVHVQSSPSATWTMNHNLGYNPSVTLLSVGGVEFEGTVTHTSVNQTVAVFNIPVAGSARFI